MILQTVLFEFKDLQLVEGQCREVIAQAIADSFIQEVACQRHLLLDEVCRCSDCSWILLYCVFDENLIVLDWWVSITFKLRRLHVFEQQDLTNSFIELVTLLLRVKLHLGVRIDINLLHNLILLAGRFPFLSLAASIRVIWSGLLRQVAVIRTTFYSLSSLFRVNRIVLSRQVIAASPLSRTSLVFLLLPERGICSGLLFLLSLELLLKAICYVYLLFESDSIWVS